MTCSMDGAHVVPVDSHRHNLTSGHGTHSLRLQLIDRPLQQRPGAGAYALLGVGIKEADEKEGYVVLPGDAPVGGEVGHGNDVAIAILGVADLELLEVGLVVHVPAKDDGAEAKASLSDGEELGLGHQLAAQNAIDVNTADLDGGVILEQLGQARDGDFGGLRRRHCGRLLKKLGAVSREQMLWGEQARLRRWSVS